MNMMLTAVVQNTTEVKIDTKYTGQTKKSDTSDPFGDCLRSVESKRSSPDKNEKVEEKKETNSAINTLPLGPAVITYIPEVILEGGSAASEVEGINTELPTLSEGSKGEVSVLGTAGVEEGKYEASATTKEGRAENKPITSAAIPEKTTAQKPQPASEIKTDEPKSTESRPETKDGKTVIKPETAANTEKHSNTKDTAHKTQVPEQNTVAAAKVKPKTSEEGKPTQIQEGSIKGEAEFRLSSSTKPDSNELKSAGEKSPQPLSGEKGKADKIDPSPTEVKTVKVQSKAAESNAAEDDISFSLPQKEEAPKKAADTQKFETPELRFSGISAGKENETPAPISGENVVSQLTRAIKERKLQDNSRLTVELAPKELGKISIEMKLSEGKLNVLLNAENKETAKALSEHLGLLKTALTANKVEIQNLDVGRPSLDMSFSNMNSSGGKFSGEERGLNKNSASSFSVYEDKSESAKPRTYSQHSQLLNYLA